MPCVLDSDTDMVTRKEANDGTLHMRPAVVRVQHVQFTGSERKLCNRGDDRSTIVEIHMMIARDLPDSAPVQGY